MTFEEDEKIYREFLSRKRMFYTRERALIFRAVYARQDHFSVDDLMFHMQNEGLKVSRATLYRSLSHLAESGILVEADFGHGHIHYERALNQDPHEHLVCKKCGEVEEVRDEAYQQALRTLAETHGFRLETHRTQMFGICRKCLASDPAASLRR